MVAAFLLLLLGLSLLQKDGFSVIISYIAAIPCFVYYFALAYFGHTGFQQMIAAID